MIGEIALLLIIPAILFAMAWMAEKRKKDDDDHEF